jgi:archaetidylinositol phosphate synthase
MATKKMLEYYLRSSYQTYCVDPLVTMLQHKMTPIQLTLLGGFLGTCVPLFMYFHTLIGAVIFLLLSGYLDSVDGSLARKQQTVTQIGSLLDIFSDRVVEFAIILGLWLYAPFDRSLMCLLMLGSILLCITSFLTVGIFSENNSEKSFHYSPGLMERPEAFIFFVLMIIFENYFFVLSLLFTLLVLFTSCLRIYEFYQFERLITRARLSS